MGNRPGEYRNVRLIKTGGGDEPKWRESVIRALLASAHTEKQTTETAGQKGRRHKRRRKKTAVHNS